MKKRSFFYENGLSLTAIGLFLVFMILQVIAGHGAYNEEQRLHGEAMVSLGKYLGESHFWTALFENWESEFLQMGILVVMSERLRQLGSAQSRKLYDEESEDHQRDDEIEERARKEGKVPAPVKQGGWKLKLYSNSLLIVFMFLFVLSFIGHLIASYVKTRAEALEHNGPVPGLFDHFTSSELWFESMQNWQSEFLAVFAVVVLSIWLRAKDSAESKPVGAAHDYTGH